MSTDQTPSDAAPYVQLFQKAHQKIVMLERLDEQMTQMITKRQELQEELRSIQSQLNTEFDTRLQQVQGLTAGETPARPQVMLAVEQPKRKGPTRFASESIDADMHERAVG